MEKQRIEKCEKQIAEITEQIESLLVERDRQTEEIKRTTAEKVSNLRKERRKLISRSKYYDRTKGREPKVDPTKTAAFAIFGKRLRDLDDAEKREYNRLIRRATRSRGNYSMHTHE